MLVSVKVAGAIPTMDAATENVPARLPATATTLAAPSATVAAVALTCANPFTSVIPVGELVVALAPLLGGVNVTVTFATGLPEPSVTRATRGAPNAVPTPVA